MHGRRLPVMGIGVGLWAMLPRFVGPALNTSDRVEIIDHLVPGVVVLAVSAGALLLRSRFERSGTGLFLSGLIVLMAGFWMTATHVPLLAQANRQEAPWAGALFHTAPGLAVLSLGVGWAVLHWSAADNQSRAQ